MWRSGRDGGKDACELARALHERWGAGEGRGDVCDEAAEPGTCRGSIRKATWFYTKGCGRLIETLPELEHDPNRPEEVPRVDADGEGVGGDDCADGLRYVLATKSQTISRRKLRGLQSCLGEIQSKMKY